MNKLGGNSSGTSNTQQTTTGQNTAAGGTGTTNTGGEDYGDKGMFVQNFLFVFASKECLAGEAQYIDLTINSFPPQHKAVNPQ